ncbi:MAG: metallophosphoesterase family protein [Longibaculum sp.]
MIKIAIISDTHNVLRHEVIEDLKACDYIIHAGDIMKQEILEQLQTITKMIVVKGNNDQLDLPEECFFEIGGYRFYLIHQKGKHQDVDFYIYGHSHQYACYREGNVQYINPGSCGRKRFSLPLTYVLLIMKENRYEIVKKDL